MTADQWGLLWGNAWVMVALALGCFVVGEATGNVSQVDKLWSIAPVGYSWIVTVRSDFDARMVLMSSVATVWGVRLTYNFSRQGGYTLRFWRGEEDYRWAYVRQWPVLNTRIGWTLFDLFFVCLYQQFLLLLISAPIVTVRDARHGLGAWDILLAALFLGFVAFETYADQTQWRFQREKKRRRAAGKALTGRYADGFIHDGAWSRCRHPNYLAEQSIWVMYFLFSVAATHRINWTIGGCLLLVTLFQGSSRLSETIQQQRYPSYRDYRRQVPRFLPRPRARMVSQPPENSSIA